MGSKANAPDSLTKPALDWSGQGVPRSLAFDDVYFSLENGLAESTHVFLEGNALQQRFAENNFFTIAELGFGTGLNFLATARLWQQVSAPGQNLSYISVEQFPLRREELTQALGCFPELAKETNALLEHYPRLVPGIHQLSFPEARIDLYLVFAEVQDALAQQQSPVDAWFLDGFAPSKNPEMWSESVFAEISRLSHSTSTFATFSSARVVKDRASAAGFELKKLPGFGKKREMLVGRSKLEKKRAPRSPEQKVMVIGGGLAGIAASYSLARRGVSVQLFERETEFALHASGNAAGIYMAYVAKQSTPTSRLNFFGFDFLRRQLHVLKSQGQTIAGSECGVQHLTTNERLLGLHAQLQQHPLDSGVAQAISAKDASDSLGLEVELPSIYYPEGGWLNPRDYSHALLATQTSERLKHHLGTMVDSLEFNQGQWQALSATGELLAEAQTVVVACAHEASRFQQLQELPLGKIRGQTMKLPVSPQSKKIKQVLCYDGYIVPEYEGFHFLGSTYDRKNDSTEIFQDQEDQLLLRLSSRVPSLSPKTLSKGPGRAAFRSTTPDRLPLLGEHPKHPGLFLNLCHGSRGIITSGICAELLAAEILELPAGLDVQGREALSPVRYFK